MLSRMFSVWFWYGSDRPGFCLGTCLWTLLILLMYAGGLEASLSVGPGGEFPRFRGSGEESRFCGYSAIQLALFTAHCRLVTQKRVLRCLPVWFLPWTILLTGLLLLPGTPALLHFCAICIGHNYRQPFIATLQELEDTSLLEFIPSWAYVSTSARFRLPTFTTTSHRSGAHSEIMPVNLAAAASWRDHLLLDSPAWMMQGSAAVAEAEVLEEEMLRAGIIASLQDRPEHPDAKVEVSKSSVSSLRLQQLEKMGFPTEKAVVALAASKQLDGAISLLIDDRIGEEAVMVSKGRNSVTPEWAQRT
uniref:Rhomboid domain-containing protein 3 n=1 Tax=Cynoglossus semilaevis TaxID=244447 RepID=A0A3P8W0P2_CYNSE